MTTSVKSLLSIMSLKRAMYEDGTIPAAQCVVDANATLVQKLQTLAPAEEIEVRVLSIDPLHAQYVRVKTDEVLVEIVQPPTSMVTIH